MELVLLLILSLVCLQSIKSDPKYSTLQHNKQQFSMERFKVVAIF